MIILKTEFSKKLLIVDYLILIVLFICAFLFPQISLEMIIVAWIAQVGVSSAAYYWKAKSENRTKIPLKVIESMPQEMRNNVDLTAIITSIINME